MVYTLLQKTFPNDPGSLTLTLGHVNFVKRFWDKLAKDPELLSEPFDKMFMTWVQGQWTSVTGKNGFRKVVFLLKKSVHSFPKRKLRFFLGRILSWWNVLIETQSSNMRLHVNNVSCSLARLLNCVLNLAWSLSAKCGKQVKCNINVNQHPLKHLRSNEGSSIYCMGGRGSIRDKHSQEQWVEGADGSLGMLWECKDAESLGMLGECKDVESLGMLGECKDVESLGMLGECKEHHQQQREDVESIGMLWECIKNISSSREKMLHYWYCHTQYQQKCTGVLHLVQDNCDC